MAIAKVRIAPKERWCDWYKKTPLEEGEVVEIITSSCAVDPPGLDLDGHPPGARWWMLTGRYLEENRRNPIRCFICEHVLEMD
jgi:hypothetical protein